MKIRTVLVISFQHQIGLNSGWPLQSALREAAAVTRAVVNTKMSQQ